MARALFFLPLATALLLAGCGNKGKLVLPDQQPQKKPAPAAQQPAASPPAANPPPGTDPRAAPHGSR